MKSQYYEQNKCQGHREDITMATGDRSEDEVCRARGPVWCERTDR